MRIYCILLQHKTHNEECWCLRAEGFTTGAGLCTEDLEAAGVDVAALQLRHEILRAVAEADSLLQDPAGYSVPAPGQSIVRGLGEASGT